ncbi:hypothetical protein FPV16_21380 [Methylobacterium sp. W2]|nr:hypothetical protein [Methylobacterium sp. W2]
MTTKSLIVAASLTLALSGAAFAQTAAGGGSTEGNMNNPGSVKSNSEKSMERSTGSATGTSMEAPGSSMAPGANSGSVAPGGAPMGGHSSGGGTSSSGMSK